MLCYEKYNWIFRELGIVLWELRHPVVFGNFVSTKLWCSLRLLLISDFYISLKDPFINDVLRIMCINIEEISIFTTEQINTLIFPKRFSCHCWWIGVTILYDFHGICLSTPSLSVLKCNVDAKRDLWRQINRVMYIIRKSNI